MTTYRYGDKKSTAYELRNTGEYVVLRTRDRQRLRPEALSRRGQRVLAGMRRAFLYPDAGVEVLQLTDIGLDEARAELNKEANVLQFAGRALAPPTHGTPLIYTENIFIKLVDDCKLAIMKFLEEARFVPKSEPRVIGPQKHMTELGPKNSYFIKSPRRIGQNVFEIAERLLQFPEVQHCYPEILRPSNAKGAFPQQWHLGPTEIAGVDPKAHISIAGAWEGSKGENVTIAIIDDGVDTGHPEFAGKIVAPRDVFPDRPSGVADPVFPQDSHGTPCAGVACASGVMGASGVAPMARLMPIRAPSREVGSALQIDAFYWAVEHGADVISCSWGPPDGPVGVPDDPRHKEVHPLPPDVQHAIDYAVKAGRGGRGCLITFAAGNGDESVDNDGYASYEKVVAVAACNDQAKRCFYSDKGKAIWCAFPSGDSWNGKTTGIWTTDRTGPDGLNIGIDAEGDWDGNFTNGFSGTSSACAGAAGVAALIIAANPKLSWSDVREIMKDCCDRIDESGGNYQGGRSPLYGHGRLNAAEAVALAKRWAPSPTKDDPKLLSAIAKGADVRPFAGTSRSPARSPARKSGPARRA